MGSTRGRRLVFTVLLIVAIAIVVWLLVCVYGSQLRAKVTDPGRSPSVVTATCLGKKGQLGNQLFQAAAAIGVAHQSRCDVVLPSSIGETKLGELCELSGISLCDKIRPSLAVTETKPGFFSPIRIPGDGRTYDLDGWFQSHLYFEGCSGRVREALRPREHLVHSAEKRIPECAQANAIGLHVRRGDYLKGNHASEFTQCTSRYYRDAVAELRGRYGQQAHVVVVSDDSTWCRSSLDIPEPVSYAETARDLDDFALLYRCQHNVIANSSFSWWAAYLKGNDEAVDVVAAEGSLGGKMQTLRPRKRVTEHSVVAPHPWYQVTGARAAMNSDDIYCPGWKVLLAKGSVAYETQNIKRFANVAATSVGAPRDHTDTNETADEAQRALYGEAYVISLETASERWRSAQQVLARAGLRATRFRAVDKAIVAELGGVVGLQRVGLLAEDAVKMTEAELGCGMSHMSLWAHTLRTGGDRVAIFEDDVASYVSKAELDRRVGEAMTVMDGDWDVLYLGKCLDKCELYTKVVEGLYRTRRPFCLHAYIMSERGMRKLLTRKLREPIDTQVMHAIEADTIKAYCLHPSVFVQDVVRFSSSMRSFKMQISNQNDCEAPA
jgi:GR25 family glycosyltransferase involved in LPS biosynthesis